ncbi:MAG: C40 family peptidase [Bryobacteraceae bacterium]|nr:C40 family peptidase [Bryobacteraceae bacterium]
MRLLLALVLAAATLVAQPQPDSLTRIRQSIHQYLGRPYVWGSSGLKSFDCSGFVYRVFIDSGLYVKRTTARKYYFSMLPAAKDDESRFATLVFFDNLKHVGIVNDEKSFYHAQSSKGTNLSEFAPYWRKLVCGYRKPAL